MKGQIVLFGTCRSWQVGARAAAESRGVQHELKRVCGEYAIRLITEKGAGDGLDRKRNLAEEVAHDLGLGSRGLRSVA